MKFLTKIFLLTILSVPVLAQSYTQAGDSHRVVSSPAGNYVFLFDRTIDDPYASCDSYTISRSTNGGAFAKVGSLQKPKNIAEVRAKVDDETLQIIKNIAKVQTDEELIRFLNKPTKELGMAALDLEMMQVAGIAFLDKQASKNSSYKVEPACANRAKAVNYTEAVYDPTSLLLRQQTPRFRTSGIFATDSLARLKWSAATATPTNQMYFGKVYRQTGLKGAYQQLENPTFAVYTNAKKDSLHYFFGDPLSPETFYKYFVTVTDFVGNELARTDTASLITVDFHKIPMIRDLAIKDTLDGLHLRWKALPAKPYYTGIQVSRSRDVREKFIVIDTLAANSTEYVDRRMLPNVNYYYQLRPILYPINGWGPMPSATGNYFFQNKKRAPLPVHGLVARHEGQGIRLNWRPSAEVDFFAYYVMRSTSESRNFQVVSKALTDTTFIDSTSTLNGRSQYLYAIKVVNMNSLESGLSNQVSIRPLKYEALPSPTGIHGFVEAGKITLGWDDATKYEPSVVGYLLYKRLATSKPITEPEKSAYFTWEKNGFSLAYPQLITQPSFVDDDLKRGQEYEYAVAAVDAFQLQSPLSPMVKFMVEKARVLAPGNFYIRPTSKGVELAWPANNLAGLQGVNIYRRSQTERTWRKLATTRSGELSYTDTSVRPGTAYLYTISFQTTDGESPKSIEKSVLK